MPVTGTIQQATKDQLYFTDSLKGDIQFRSLSNINWVFGQGSNTTSMMKLNSSTLNLNSSNVIMPGNVGIGTAFPAFNLDVNGSINFAGTLYNNGSVFNTSPWLFAGSNAYFSSGYAGIGTSTPSHELDVVGTAAADTVKTSTISAKSGTINIGTDAGTSVINIGGNNTTVSLAGTLAYVTASDLTIADRKITLNKGGSATSASDTGFEIEENGAITGYIKTSSDRNSFLFKSPNGTVASMNLAGSAINFNSNSLVVASNGYIGVGVSNPAAGLDVSSTALFRGGIYSTAAPTVSGQGAWLGWNRSSDGATWHMNQKGSFSGGHVFGEATVSNVFTEYMRLTGTGSLGLGTSNPAYTLDVQGGNARLNNAFVGDVGLGASYAGFAHSNCVSTSNTYGFVQASDGTTYVNSATGTAIHFKQNNTTELGTWTSTGLGIAKSNPAYALDVTGTINSTDKVMATNDVLIGTTTVSEKLSINSGNIALIHGGVYGGSTGTDKWTSVGDKSLAAAPHHEMSNYGVAVAWSNDGAFFGLRDYSSKKDAVISATNNLRFQAASNSDLMILTSTGRLGVGTSNPQYAIDTTGTINAAQLLINGTALSTSTGGGFSAIASGAAYSLCNIGIGTSNPQTNLDVVGSINASFALYESNVQLSSKYALSNAQSNYHLTTAFNTYSNWANGQYAPSNTLSNYVLTSTATTQYAPSNTLSNYTLTSTANTQYAPSNATSNISTAATFGSNTASWTSNNHLPLAGGVLTGSLTGTSVTMTTFTGSNATFSNLTIQGSITSVSLTESNITTCNVTASNISACNITATTAFTEAGTLLSTKYAPSNTLSNFALTSTANTQYAPSNTLSNFALTSTANTQYAPSNTLSNYALTSTANTQYAPSNTLSNYTLASTANTQYAPSNTLSNYALTSTANTQYAPSNTLSNYALTSTANTQYAPSNTLSNYQLTSAFTTYSNWANGQYAPSNTLSNYVLTSTANTQYAPSNTLSNYVLTSTANTQYAPSNATSNISAAATFGSNTASWTSNNHLPLAGGTLTGSLTGTSITMTTFTGSNATFSNLTIQGSITSVSLTESNITTSNVTASNISACNITATTAFTEAGTLLSTKYAPSNTLSNYALTSTANTQYAPSNTLSNYTLTSTANTQYAPSNTLSNYALTSTANTQYAPSNTLSNYTLASTANMDSELSVIASRHPTNSSHRRVGSRKKTFVSFPDTK